MQSDRNGQRSPTLHVLLVEHEPDVLNRNAALLLAKGYDISTCRVAADLSERVERLRPDVILMDVLMPQLGTDELAALTARCRGGSEPVLVLHTKLLRPMLGRVIDVRAVYGVIPKGDDDDAEFIQKFQDITDSLTSELPTLKFVPRSLGLAPSGTYAVASKRSRVAG